MTTDQTSTNGHAPAAVDPAGEPDPMVVALGRAVQRAQRRVETVDKNVIQLAADVSALRSCLSPPPGPGGPDDEPAAAGEPGPAAVRSWLLGTDAGQAVTDLADLIAWVDAVYLRYSRASVSSCWLWHPEVIEELWWLRGAHADAYHREDGSWLRVGDWHDRQRPGVERRVNALLGKCALSLHTDVNGRAAEVTEPAPAPLAGQHSEVAAAWVKTRTAGPVPTDVVLAEAERAENLQHRSHR